MLIRSRGLVRRSRRRGAAFVELALVLPILIYVLLGIWELGRLIQTQQIIAGACREGGRLASTGTYTAGDASLNLVPVGTLPVGRQSYEVQKFVVHCLERNGLNVAVPELQVRVSNQTKGYTGIFPPGATTGGGDPVYNATQDITADLDKMEVELTYPYRTMRWSPIQFFLNDSRLIRVTTTWYCLRDKPVNVNDTIPRGPWPAYFP